jgi:hypothetical protein
MEDLTVKAGSYDFGPAHAALGRYVDASILAGVSSAVLLGRDLVDLHSAGWADREADALARRPHLPCLLQQLVMACAALLLLEESRFTLDDPTRSTFPSSRSRLAAWREGAGRH